ncbi:uncharacterized protein LOC127533090 [Acanthochromis polyacanthus]|uniref:uncharacterized protein LOC127533090 n=1 Tax=Acanthochromis polyacanthus TaxID=80966 RepID=UPI0022346256|nr:uncharacterized protein LOC127533090 [Acanthochromis polyacanthus]
MAMQAASAPPLPPPYNTEAKGQFPLRSPEMDGEITGTLTVQMFDKKDATSKSTSQKTETTHTEPHYQRRVTMREDRGSEDSIRKAMEQMNEEKYKVPYGIDVLRDDSGCVSRPLAASTPLSKVSSEQEQEVGERERERTYWEEHEQKEKEHLLQLHAYEERIRKAQEKIDASAERISQRWSETESIIKEMKKQVDKKLEALESEDDSKKGSSPGRETLTNCVGRHAASVQRSLSRDDYESDCEREQEVLDTEEPEEEEEDSDSDDPVSKHYDVNIALLSEPPTPRHLKLRSRTVSFRCGRKRTPSNPKGKTETAAPQYPLLAKGPCNQERYGRL